MADLIWMENEETGGRSRLPDVAAWRVRGWKPCDGPPPEEDRLHDPAEEPAAEPVNLDSTPVDGENLPEALHADERFDQGGLLTPSTVTVSTSAVAEPVPTPKTTKASAAPVPSVEEK